MVIEVEVEVDVDVGLELKREVEVSMGDFEGVVARGRRLAVGSLEVEICQHRRYEGFDDE